MRTDGWTNSRLWKPSEGALIVIEETVLSVYGNSPVARRLGAWTDYTFPTGTYFVFFSSQRTTNDVVFWTVLHGCEMKRIRVSFLDWKEVSDAD